jgi:hypothetical protein
MFDVHFFAPPKQKQIGAYGALLSAPCPLLSVFRPLTSVFRPLISVF